LPNSEKGGEQRKNVHAQKKGLTDQNSRGGRSGYIGGELAYLDNDRQEKYRVGRRECEKARRGGGVYKGFGTLVEPVATGGKGGIQSA